MNTQKDIFFPQLYIAADESSNMAQANFLFYYKLSTTCLVFAVIFSAENAYFKILPVLSALFFLASLAAYTYAKFQKLQDNWYRSRAIAESIKTATWRLIMSAQPFNSESEELNLERFKNLLDEFLTGNKTLGALLSEKWQSNNVITERMIEVLRMSFEDKKDTYQKERIDNQRTWYIKKSGENRKNSKKFLWMIILIYSLAITLLLLRIYEPELSFLSIDICAIVASGLIGWTEIKKFDELSSAYGLTAHEIGIIDSRYKSVNDSDHLSSFVSDAENAFSREHTQWAARRDH